MSIIGDFIDLETSYLIKKLSDAMNIRNIECRQEGVKIPYSDRSQYIFNSTINGIEESDCILILGSNIREEAPIINTRIRKHILNKNIPISLIGENFDLTYDFNHLGNDLNILKSISDGENDFCKELEQAKKPMIIIGQSVLNRNDCLNTFSLIEEIVHKYSFIGTEWNGVNTLQLSAARVGSLDMECYQASRSLEDIYNDAETGTLKLLFAFGADEIDFDKLGSAKIIYMGSHGDRGASNADLILPSAAYTEKDGIYINTEGRLQYAYQASFPPNEAKTDWKIINQISEMLNLSWGIINIDDVRNQIKDQYPYLFNKVKADRPYKRLLANKSSKINFEKKEIQTMIKDFYLTDTISRLSKTMAECSQIRKELRNGKVS